MSSRILIISDIHANYPALAAVARQVKNKKFDTIINVGDSLVYAPFPNETLDWLRAHNALSILGNTDIKVLRLLAGKELKKPRKPDKRVMYDWTAEHLSSENKKFLSGIHRRINIELEGHRVGIFHGSPASDSEHLFADTPEARFRELAKATDCTIVLVGHSHSPFHKTVNGVHFINPGSVGRMFDGKPTASFAIMELAPAKVTVSFYRCAYEIDKVVQELKSNNLPAIYAKMYRLGRKLN